MIEHLLDWIGPVLLVILSTAAVAVVRTITNKHSIRRLEARMTELEKIPREMTRVQTRLEERIKHEDEATQRNDAAHGEIKDLIEAARQERKREIKELKNDLIRELRNGHARSRA